jgi:hypothetical protein
MHGAAFGMPISILTEGMIWRVADGKTVRIWEDRWIPSVSTNRIQSPNFSFPSNARVSELIDYDKRWWNVQILQEHFSEEEIEKICGLAICPGRRSDQLVWGGTKNGVYSVRSGYHLAKEGAQRDEASCSSWKSNEELWRLIWRLRGPKALQMFIWRACQEILPTRENLQRRHILSDPMWPVCGVAVESVGHILWNCQSAKDVWLECPTAIQKTTSDEVSFREVVQKMRDRLDGADFLLFATVARQLWFRRNIVVQGGVFQSPTMILRQAREQLESYKTVGTRDRNMGDEIAPVVRCMKWEKPPEDYLKLNWDAAVSRETNRVGVGVILRDHAGAL